MSIYYLRSWSELFQISSAENLQWFPSGHRGCFLNCWQLLSCTFWEPLSALSHLPQHQEDYQMLHCKSSGRTRLPDTYQYRGFVSHIDMILTKCLPFHSLHSCSPAKKLLVLCQMLVWYPIERESFKSNKYFPLCNNAFRHQSFYWTFNDLSWSRTLRWLYVNNRLQFLNTKYFHPGDIGCQWAWQWFNQN